MTTRRIEELKIDLEPIGHALSDNMLAVPMYQRSYAWEEVHVRDLYQDVTSALADGEKDYFVGSIVVTKDPKAGFDVVDGQQRLATTVILLATIRDWLFPRGDKERAQQIEQKYLVERDFRTQEATPRLRLNEVDSDFFHRRILSSPDSPDRSVEPSKDSHRRIAATAELARKHIEYWVGTSNKEIERIVSLKDYLDEHVQVIWVRVPDDANAFVIFETLNDRGLDLAISDLLKNFLFLMAEDRIKEVQTQWVSMLATLEAVDDETIVVEFIRHLWSSKYGATRERDLYAAIKKATTSKQAAIDLAKELATSSKLYAAILNTDHATWSEYGMTARGHMSTLNLLGMVQIRPLLLAVLSGFKVTEIKRTLRLMVSWGVRFLITGGLGGGTMEKYYADTACKVRAGKITTSAQLTASLASVVLGDKEFETSFSVARVSKANLARYYLRVLERQNAGVAQPELVPNANQEEVNLEHVLPRNPDSKWSGFSSDDAAIYCNRLGNLALLSVNANTVAANASFADKRSVLSASDFQLTEAIGKSTSWTLQAIESRQKMLAGLAVVAWSLK